MGRRQSCSTGGAQCMTMQSPPSCHSLGQSVYESFGNTCCFFDGQIRRQGPKRAQDMMH